MYRASAYAGGFVGYNVGSISNSYDLTYIYANGQDGSTTIAGFAAYNSGSITNSYCATALTTAGTGTVDYAFAPLTSGTFNNNKYLHSGTYEFVGQLYAFNSNTGNSAGKDNTYNDLSTITTSNKAKTSKYHSLTSETTYPYKAVVKDGDNGNLLHYGNWQLKPTLGSYGVYYWEYEEGGNEGYHISFVGLENGSPIYNSTLCSEHDDGGIITSYGYGYYHTSDIKVQSGTMDDNYIKVDSINGITLANSENTNANKALNEQFGFTFHSYTTYGDDSSAITLNTDDINASITLSCKYNGGDETSNTFYISPFFGDAIALYQESIDDSYSEDLKAHISTNKSYGRDVLNSELKTPGAYSNKYEIRSIAQLQYLNWNSNSKDPTSLVTKNSTNYSNYNYLMSTSSEGLGNQSANAAGHSNNQYLYFEVSHDLNAITSKGNYLLSNFTPIAGQATSSTNKESYNAVLYAWFGSHFYGESYKIQELHIESNAFTVGVFGVSAGAEIKDVILYSKYNETNQKATIIRKTSSTDTPGGYSIGGLIGVAYDYNSSSTSTTSSITNVIKNCAISGYRIIDESSNEQYAGEANVGGLIGVSNINVEQCSAVVDIEINAKHNNNGTFVHGPWGNFIRVGGLCGAVQHKITNCYTGGTITVDEDVLKETYNSETPNYSNYVSSGKATSDYSTHIYIAGIAGSGFTMNYQNFTNNSSIKDGRPDVENCYTYMSFPDYEGTIRSITMITSMADRFSSTNTSGQINPIINNCYYLATSADIDISKAPSYYFRDGSWRNEDQYSPKKLLSNNSSYLSGMKEGYVDYVAQLINGDSPNNPTIDVLKPLSYLELKGDTDISNTNYNFIETLNNYNIKKGINITWDNVSTEIGSVGKYSFPGNDKALDGKAYPFPTVVRQDEYYVHYGTWPFPSAYFENALVTMNIFDFMEDDGYAYYPVYLTLNGNVISGLQFEIDDKENEDNPVLEVVGDSLVYDGENNAFCFIKVKALRTGTTTLKATWTQDGVSYSDSQTFTVTADLEAHVDPSEVTLGNGDSAPAQLSACSLGHYIENENGTSSCDSNYDFSTNNNIKWDATSSFIGTSTNEAANTTINSNILEITGTGNDASIQIKATYTYNGNEYYAYTNATVNRKGGVGLYASDTSSSTILEADVLTSDEVTDSYLNDGVTGEPKSYLGGIGPSYSQDIYLYQINSDILTKAYNALDKCVATSCSIMVDAVYADDFSIADNFIYSISSISDKDSNGFSYLGLNVTYRPNNLDNVGRNILLSVIVTDQDTNVKYYFYRELSLEFTPYDLTLNYNYVGSTNKTIKATKDLNLEEYTPSRTGYTFDGWFKDKECIEQPFTYSFSGIKDDTTIYAKWTPISKDITLTNDDLTITQGPIKATYDKGFDSDLVIDSGFVNVENKKLIGFVDNNGSFVINVEIDENNIAKASYNKDALNKFILSNETNLYARYSDNTILNLYTYINSDHTDSYLIDSHSITHDSNTSSITISVNGYNKTTYSITGWYTDDGAKILDENGSIVEGAENVSGYTKDGYFDTDNKVINLYAHWTKQVTEKIDAYVLTSKEQFTDGNSYIIASSNTYGSTYALINSNDSVSSTSLTVNKDDNETLYINASDANSYAWTAKYYSGGNNQYYSLENSGKYLSVDRYWSWYYYYYYLTLSSNNTSINNNHWSYNTSESKLSGQYQNNNTHYLTYSDGSFDIANDTGSSRGANIYLYKFVSDAISITNTQELDYYDGGTLTQSDDIEIEIESIIEELPVEDIIEEEVIIDETNDEVIPDEVIEDDVNDIEDSTANDEVEETLNNEEDTSNE